MKGEGTGKAGGKVYYFEILRFLACIGVVIIHSTVDSIEGSFGSFDFWLGLSFNSIARFAVPVFAMITGALLLDSGYNYTPQKNKKHILRMVTFFVFWSVLYAVFYQIVSPIMKHEPVDGLNFVFSIFRGTMHLWYVYMLIGFYLILPLLRLWVNDKNKKYVEYFIILGTIFAFILPQVVTVGSYYSTYFEHLKCILDTLNLSYIGGFTTYFLLGWYLNNYELKSKSLAYTLGVAGLIVTIVGSGALSITLNDNVQMFGYTTINVLLYSVMVFVLFKSIFKNNDIKENKLVALASRYSLGIYAIHPFFISIIRMVIERVGITSSIITMPVIFLFAFIGSLIATIILSKLPILKKIV